MSWYQLLDISRENRTIRQAQAAAQPTACPLCGTVLLRDRAQRWRCQFDGWTWDGVKNPLVELAPEQLKPTQSGNL